MRNHLLALCAISLLANSCSTSKSTASTDAAAKPQPSASATVVASAAVSIAAPTAEEAALVAKRPYRLRPPPGAVSKPLPLVVFLHGYGGSATWFDDKTKVKEAGEQERFVAAIPEGTLDSKGKRFWNATDACCNFENKDVDDIAYLRAVLKDASSRASLDPKQLFVVGFDNGGFLAHRAACDLADLLAAVIAIGGANWKDASRCVPKAPVAVLHVHGDSDQTVPYGGGRVKWLAEGPEHPGARQTVADWAKRHGCGPNTSPMPTVSLDDDMGGVETTVERYNGCERGEVELWTRKGKKHQIGTGQRALHLFTEFLFAHAKR